MPRPDPVYLDFAATSAIRPAVVTTAMQAYMEDVGATAGRGGHRLAAEAGRVALRCRQALAALLGLPGDPGRLAFVLNATHALNTALHGMLDPGDVLLISAFDHNAVLRPARVLEDAGVEVRRVPGRADGSLDADAYERALDGAHVVALNAVSNVLGTALDIPVLAGLAHDAGALVVVDGAQAAGHMPFRPADAGADVLALSGHKGLLGPQGVGVLWARDGVDVRPLLTGGTGGDSLDPGMPAAWPDHIEAGTTNGPGIAGLGAGIEWLRSHDVGALHGRVMARAMRLRAGLCALPSVRVLSPPVTAAPIITFVADVDPATLARRLDDEFGILCRAGLHCAPDVHRLIGTAETGAVRLSLGWCTEDEDVNRAVGAVAAIVTGA